MKPIHYLCALVIIIAWGGNVVAGKLGVSSIPPIFFVGLRAVIVAILLFPFLKSMPEQKVLFGFIILIFGVLQFVLFFVGLTRVDASVAIILIQTLVPFGLIMGRLFFGERMHILQIFGLVVAFSGVIIIAGDPKASSEPVYVAVTVGGAFCMALGSNLVKRLGSIDVFRLQGWLALGSAPLLFASSYLLESNQIEAVRQSGWIGWGTVVYTAVATTIIGHGLWAYLLQNLPVYRVMPISLLAAVAGVMFSVIILGEQLSIEIVIGGTLTLIGVAVIQIVQTKTA